MGNYTEIGLKFIVAARVDFDGVSIDAIVSQAEEVGADITRQIVTQILAGVQEALMDQPVLGEAVGAHALKGSRHGEQCQCREFIKRGWCHGKRQIDSQIGRLKFRIRNVACRDCGRVYSPLLRYLGLEERARHTHGLEQLVIEAVSAQTFKRSESDIERATGRRVPDSTSQRWLVEGDWDALNLGSGRRPSTVMADGTGIKKAGGEKGELRIVIGLDGNWRPFGMGAWAGESWSEIGSQVEEMLSRSGRQSTLFVSDGELGIAGHLAKLCDTEQRCRWHVLRDAGYMLWSDDVNKGERDVWRKRLKGVLSIELPGGDYETVSERDRKKLLDKVRESENAYSEMIGEFARLGYSKAKRYLENALGKLFADVKLWLSTGVIMPGTTTILERIMREIGRRLKKIAYGWSDRGAAKMAQVLLKKVYEPEGWDEFWSERRNLNDRCSIELKSSEITHVTTLGY